MERRASFLHRVIALWSGDGKMLQGLRSPERFLATMPSPTLETVRRVKLVQVKEWEVSLELLRGQVDLLVLDLNALSEEGDEGFLDRLIKITSSCRYFCIPVLPVLGEATEAKLLNHLGSMGEVPARRRAFFWLQESCSCLDGVDASQVDAAEQLLLAVAEALKPLSILHLSDLHFGSEASWISGYKLWSDWCPRPKEEDLYQAVRDVVESKRSLFDAVFITGDLTERGRRKDFRRVERLKTRLHRYMAERGGADKSGRILDIMGNHDAFWGFAPVQKIGGRARRRKWAEELHGGCGDRYLRTVHQLGERDGVAAAVYLVDTTRNGSVARGRVAEEDLQWLRTENADRLQSADARRRDAYRRGYRIALLHHHVKPVPTGTETGETFQRLHNAEAILSFIASGNFDVIFHGHKHRGFRQLRMDEFRVRWGQPQGEGGTAVPTLWPTAIVGGGAVFFRGRRSAFNVVDLYQSYLEVEEYRFDEDLGEFRRSLERLRFPRAPLLP